MTPKQKTPTETTTLDEFWGDFESEYKPFVNWYYDKDSENKFTILDFCENEPKKYTNKWNREQWKIQVQDDTDQVCFLSGGKRLFQTILAYCKKVNKMPTDLGTITIFRIGTGFDTRYKIENS